MATAVAAKGLEGIVATTSSICWIDGDAGVLAYRGIDIHKLAEQSNFEETTYLLWNGRLPNAAELDAFRKELAKARVLDPEDRRDAAHLPQRRHAHGGAAHDCLRAELLRPGREGQLARRQCPQELPADLADRHDGRRLRSHPQRQAAGRCPIRRSPTPATSCGC